MTAREWTDEEDARHSEMVVRTRREAGLPPTVEDVAALTKIARLLQRSQS